MISSKMFLKSKTVIGVVIAALPTLLPALGVDFSAADGQFVSSSVDAIIQGVGSILALYGRFVAKDKLKVK